MQISKSKRGKINREKQRAENRGLYSIYKKIQNHINNKHAVFQISQGRCQPETEMPVSQFVQDYTLIHGS